MADWPFGAAIRAVREGLSARAGLSAFRAGGGAIRDTTWFRAYGEAKAAVAGRETEFAAPLNRRPTAGEMTPFTTRTATGVLQQIEVFVRDRATGEVRPVPFSVTSDRGVTRQAAIDEALSVIGAATTQAVGGSPPHDEVVLGAAHVGTFLMTPGGG